MANQEELGNLIVIRENGLRMSTTSGQCRIEEVGECIPSLPSPPAPSPPLHLSLPLLKVGHRS